MRSARVATLLVSARKQLELTQAELARRANVSTRLVAELERGKRPNVSFETALRVLEAAGVSMMFRTAHGDAAELRSRKADSLEREARAVQRRKTWTGSITSLRSPTVDPDAGRPGETRLGAAHRVSQIGYFLAEAGQRLRAEDGRAKGTRRKAR